MKKIIILITIFFITFTNSFASDYKLTNSDKITINKLTYKIQKLLNSKNLSFRKILENKINTLQKENRTNKQMYTIFKKLKINLHMVSYENEYLKHYQNFHIDFDKIQKNWLSRHNQARQKLGYSKYSYDKRLNNTAYEWSVIQNQKGKMTHKRNFNDSYYDYKKIEKWFNDRGIKCKVKGRATSSESVGKYGYYCKNNNCTNELDKSLREIFNIYMSEKGLGGIAEGHYRAITHKYISKIGLGLKIKENFTDRYSNYRSYDYYVTTHYCTEFKK